MVGSDQIFFWISACVQLRTISFSEGNLVSRKMVRVKDGYQGVSLQKKMEQVRVKYDIVSLDPGGENSKTVGDILP